VPNIAVNFAFTPNSLTHMYKFCRAMQHSHRHFGYQKATSVVEKWQLYTANNRMHRDVVKTSE